MDTQDKSDCYQCGCCGKYYDMLDTVDVCGPCRDELQAKLDAAMAMLEQLEWINLYCPICRAFQYDGHKRGCKMKAILHPKGGE